MNNLHVGSKVFFFIVLFDFFVKKNVISQTTLNERSEGQTTLTERSDHSEGTSGLNGCDLRLKSLMTNGLYLLAVGGGPHGVIQACT